MDSAQLCVRACVCVCVCVCMKCSRWAPVINPPVINNSKVICNDINSVQPRNNTTVCVRMRCVCVYGVCVCVCVCCMSVLDIHT